MSNQAVRAAGLYWRCAAFALVLLGAAASAYLLALHLAAAGSGLFDICQTVFGGNCRPATSGDPAALLGIPLAGWGVVYFAVVAVLLLLAYSLGETFIVEGSLAALVLAVSAAGLGLFLTGTMIAQAAVCPLCLAVHVVNLLLVPVIVMASGRTYGQILQSLRAATAYLAGGRVDDPVLVRWKVTGLVAAMLAGIVAYQWILIQTDRRAAEADAPLTFAEVLAEFEAAPPQQIPLSADDPRRGGPDAKLELVLFSDFQCPACRRFAAAVSRVGKSHPELAVVFKHYPLSKECNPRLHSSLHPLSCGAAYAAEAARRQGKFWEYHDALFASTRPLAADVLRQIAGQLELDMPRFEADAADPATRVKVESDAALGKKLNLKGTPTAFLNDRAIPARGLRFLDELVGHAAAHD